MRDCLMRPDAVVFDFGETLVDFLQSDYRAGYQAVLSLAQGEADADAAMAFSGALELPRRKDDARLEIPMPQVLRLVFKTFGLTPRMSYEQMETVFWDAAYRCTPVPGAHEVLRLLKASGIACGIVSNFSFSGATLEYELCKHGMRDPFAFVLSSADVAFRKPDPVMFRLAASLCGAGDLSRVWYVGDCYRADVLGARGAGMVPIWISEKTPPAGDPVLRLPDMEALRALLQPLIAREI